MATTIPLKDELYNQVVERARAAHTTPEQWLDQIIAERLDREDLVETTRTINGQMHRKMGARGVKPSGIEREIAHHRRGR